MFEILSLFFYENELINLFSKYINFNNVDLNFFQIAAFNIDIDITANMFYSVSYLNIVFYFVFFIGIILFWHSKSTEKRILNFCYSVIFIYSCKRIFNLIVYVYNDYDKFIFTDIVYFIKAFLLFYLSFTYIKYWNSKNKFINTESLNTEIKDFEKTKDKTRLFHFILDNFLIICVFSSFVLSFPSKWFLFLESNFGDNLSTLLLFVFFSSIYYLLFEGLFKITPSKCLTDSIIISSNNTNVKCKNLLTRVLARRIPFNAFSFLTASGWHDNLSDTTVVKLNKINNKYDKSLLVILVSILILIVYTILKEFINF